MRYRLLASVTELVADERGIRLYSRESMGAGQVLSIVQRFLVDHQHLVRSDLTVQANMMSLLNAFVDVGWPEAHRLTHRLEEVFG